MIWLGIDTSTKLCRACLWHAADSAIVIEKSQDIGTGHAEILMSQIDALFADGAYQRSDITQIICSIGPGSFTGVRVGLATAKALAQALDVPVIGISTLESLALDMAKTRIAPFSVAIDARREQFYWQSFDVSGTAETTPAIGVASDLSHLEGSVIAGSGANSLTKFAYLDDKATGSMGAMMQCAMDKTPINLPLVPLYLRSADAKQPKVPFAVERQRGPNA